MIIDGKLWYPGGACFAFDLDRQVMVMEQRQIRSYSVCYEFDFIDGALLVKLHKRLGNLGSATRQTGRTDPRSD